ncbi:MAG TPA: 2-amino-4-hydroxy-6-hydroxymethyldihydropteridine diphosphokinase [bacterium]|nr:2-amino-4-hydroxy-6-hydroxymethyldihydropteridine diphosphokinase [bacterium]HMW36185.1 2-amino-4-hydroxy-6-hydroxymethyldihydropteridine diphosphokinase [bacterium]HMY35268.1 2-amino-4-hydroxy-6-hydroxymethyldihydropteridine diphosphokinase [bacterium]HMZ03610.1 2-amino-4-hydroxy-6-hydroxymethyldihydropteridine diphosphokinase [bacterium]HNB10419.1 2-amino-4-hydroxy-6-hydroxymethyldihydropteridine diphosphokinase [bacterium]
MKNKVLLSLGSNIGDRMQHLREAVDLISRFAGIKKMASIYETEPVSPIMQDNYYNTAMIIDTDLDAQSLMKKLLDVEKSLGRERTIPGNARTIDLDIILFDDLIMNTPDTVIPHPRFAERNFVLVPSVEIAGNWLCPIRHLTIQEILNLSRDTHHVQYAVSRDNPDVIFHLLPMGDAVGH